MSELKLRPPKNEERTQEKNRRRDPSLFSGREAAPTGEVEGSRARNKTAGLGDSPLRYRKSDGMHREC